MLHISASGMYTFSKFFNNRSAVKRKVLEVHIHLLYESGRYYIQVWSYIHRHLYVGGEVSSSVGGVSAGLIACKHMHKFVLYM